MTNRIMKLEKRVAPVDIAKWMRLPVGEMPDWVLCTISLDHPVSPAEASVLDKDKEFGRRFELLRAADEGTAEWYAIRSGLINYVERIQHRARTPIGCTKRTH